jgi:5-(carboxyamino)imidazole ribonucleotide mutase
VNNKIDVAIIIGSSSDLVSVTETIEVLKKFKLSYSLNIASAHRTHNHLKQCIKLAENSNAKVFIAVAGMSAALPGIIASETILPVIGVPVYSKSLSSFDSLFSIVQMPKGVPVATVAIGKAGAANAAILAARIIAVTADNLKVKLRNFKDKMSDDIIKEDLKLKEYGLKKYLCLLKKSKKIDLKG